jgi:uroporphyrinogen decarboxylase
MTSRELVVRTLNHESVDRAPRDLWASPGVEMSQGDELAEANARYPSDIVPPDFKYPSGKRTQGKPYREGPYTDAWGCTWHASERGTLGVLQAPPLADFSKIADYRPPFELLDAARFAKLNRACETTSRFVLARSDIRPFERLQSLHGPEATLVDLARGAKELRSLLAMLHDFFCKEAELWAGTEVDAVALRDGWGSAESLLITAETWRDIFRPLYREYCQILRARDKFVFFRSDGNIADIFGDLIQIGVDAIHAPWCTMDFERLTKRYRGGVTFWGGLPSPQVMFSGTLDEIREAVRGVRTALDFGAGGVIAHCSWEANVPVRSIAAVFEQWMLPLPWQSFPAGLE